MRIFVQDLASDAALWLNSLTITQ